MNQIGQRKPLTPTLRLIVLGCAFAFVGLFVQVPFNFHEPTLLLVLVGPLLLATLYIGIGIAMRRNSARLLLLMLLAAVFVCNVGFPILALCLYRDLMPPEVFPPRILAVAGIFVGACALIGITGSYSLIRELKAEQTTTLFLDVSGADKRKQETLKDATALMFGGCLAGLSLLILLFDL